MLPDTLKVKVQDCQVSGKTSIRGHQEQGHVAVTRESVFYGVVGHIGNS